MKPAAALRYILVSSFLFFSIVSNAQISPPGANNTKAVLWQAVGFNQTIKDKFLTKFYVGYSRESDPNNERILKKQGIAVINQETYYRINKNWQIALCASYRAQNFYTEAAPYLSKTPAYRREIRYYTRAFYSHQVKNVSLIYSARFEYRDFYMPDWKAWTPNALELRYRFKAQASVPINKSKTTSFIVANELLFAMDDYKTYWSAYHFTEDRFTNFIQYKYNNNSIIDAGLMHQFFKENGKVRYILYLSVDFVFNNPFDFLKKKTTVVE